MPPPGPISRDFHERCTRHFKGLSSQVKLFPVAFESGSGCELRDADGNRYIDFSSGIYVTTLGHCHPKISEAIARHASTLMNAHDFTTPIKTMLMEKLAQVLPGDLKGFQLYDSGTTAVEAGLRVLRAATGKHEIVSCFNDYHGKTFGAVSLGHILLGDMAQSARRGRTLWCPPDTYRPIWTRSIGTIDTDQSTWPDFTTNTPERALSAASQALSWSPSRAGPVRSCRPTTFSRNCVGSATHESSC